ncbi:MAG: hypothetical protein PHC54_03210 [Candidatus Omnitrophica bacterium]|nr:hypothetical protein [Candidatus Omnitrophota bacterium]MDD5592442.1 hypothetical protein [Candidatus Omnitrophota bacterium]
MIQTGQNCIDKKVKLEIDLHEYKFIVVTAKRHKDMLNKLGINELLKKDLVKDINIITSILEKSEVKTKEG